MERISILTQEHLNCSTSKCRVCDGLKYFNNKEYSKSLIFFQVANEIDILDMIIFDNYITNSDSLMSTLHRMYDYDKSNQDKSNQDNNHSLKYIKYTSSVLNSRYAHQFLMNKATNKEDRMLYAEKYLSQCTKDDVKYNTELIYEVAIYLLEKGEKERAHKIAELSSYPKYNWILNDTIYHFISYAGKEPYFLQKFEEKIRNIDTKHFLYKKSCNTIANCFLKNKNYDKVIEYYTKAKNYYKLTKIYMKLKNDIEVKKYFDLAIQNRQYDVYKLKIDNDNFLEYTKLLYKNFCKFAGDILYRVMNNDDDDIVEEINKKNYSDVLSFLHSILKKYEDKKPIQFWNINNNDLYPEDICVLFYTIGFIYRKVIKDEVLYKKYMKYGNIWYPLHQKYESDYGNSLGYTFYDDPEYEPNQTNYTLWNNEQTD